MLRILSDLSIPLRIKSSVEKIINDRHTISNLLYVLNIKEYYCTIILSKSILYMTKKKKDLHCDTILAFLPHNNTN